jgi:hypothetical protein
MLKSRKGARFAFMATSIAVLAIVFASVTGAAAAAPITPCSADASSSAATGSQTTARAGSSTSSSSSSRGSGTLSASLSSRRTTTSNGVTTTSYCNVTARVVILSNGQRFCEARAERDGVIVSQRDPVTGTFTSCHASAIV